MGGGSSGGSTTTTNEPWAGVQPYITDLYQQASNLKPPTPASFTPAQLQSQNLLTQAANRPVPWGAQQAAQVNSGTLGGNYLRPTQPAYNAGMNQLKQTASGEYLNKNNNPFMSEDINPYASALYSSASRPVVENFNEDVLPALTAQFAAAGQAGSPQQQSTQIAAADKLQRNLADMSSNIYGSVYENAANRRQTAFEGERNRMQGASGLAGQFYGNERDHMQQAIAMAPTASMLPMNIQSQQANWLSQVGNQQQSQQNAMNAASDAQSQSPYNLLQQQSSLYGSGSPFITQSQPYYQNGGMSALGGGLSGAASGAMMGSMFGPWGTAIGAGVGGLAGLFAGS